MSRRTSEVIMAKSKQKRKRLPPNTVSGVSARAMRYSRMNKDELVSLKRRKVSELQDLEKGADIKSLRSML